MSQYHLSILVLGYNQRDKVLKLLHCIETQKNIETIPFEVIYTDDGSTDGTIEALKNGSFRFMLHVPVSEEPHIGRATARNRAAQQASGEWLMFLDGDGELNDDFIFELWKNKAVGTVRQSAICVHPDSFCPARRYEVLRSAAYRFGDKPVEQRLLQSGCFLIEKELFVRLGGFQEALRGRSGEDVDLGSRLARSKIELRAVPTAKFFHNHPRTIAELIEVKRKYSSQGLSQMVKLAPELFRLARLNWLYNPQPPHNSTGMRSIAKWVVFHLPVRLFTKIADSNSQFWWCGRTIIPLLAFYGTMRGFHDYLISGHIGAEDV